MRSAIDLARTRSRSQIFISLIGIAFAKDIPEARSIVDDRSVALADRHPDGSRIRAQSAGEDLS